MHLLRGRRIIIFFLLRYLDEKYIPLGREVSHQKVSTSPQLSMSPKGTGSFSDGSVGRFPAVLFGCFHHSSDPSLAQHVVYLKFAFNQEKARCCSYYILSVKSKSADLHYSRRVKRACDKTTGLLVLSGTVVTLHKNGILGDWKMVP